MPNRCSSNLCPRIDPALPAVLVGPLEARPGRCRQTIVTGITHGGAEPSVVVSATSRLCGRDVANRLVEGLDDLEEDRDRKTDRDLVSFDKPFDRLPTFGLGDLTRAFIRTSFHN